MGPRWERTFVRILLTALGKRSTYCITWIVSFWYVLFYPSLRSRTGYYLRRRFPDDQSWVRRFIRSCRLVSEFGMTLVDLLAYNVLGEGSLTAVCPDAEQIYEFCEPPRGIVLVNAHVGCWQVGLSALKHLKKTVSIVMIPDPRVQDLLSRYGIRVIDPRTGLTSVVEMMQTLRRGEIVGLMGDRVFGNEQNTVKATFLGDEISLPLSPYLLASATKVPIAVMMASRISSRTYKLRLAKVIEVPPELGRNPGSYAPYAQQFADCLEQFVQQYPWQYFNFYNLWEN